MSLCWNCSSLGKPHRNQISVNLGIAQMGVGGTKPWFGALILEKDLTTLQSGRIGPEKKCTRVPVALLFVQMPKWNEIWFRWGFPYPSDYVLIGCDVIRFFKLSMLGWNWRIFHMNRLLYCYDLSPDWPGNIGKMKHKKSILDRI